MKILAINGSPTQNGTIQTILKKVLTHTGSDNRLIHLREYKISPCFGCRACVRTNTCIQKDDWSDIVTPLAEADLLIIGFPTYYGAAFGLNALTHNFLERWFSLRHNGLKIKARKAVAVITSGEGHDQQGLQNLKTFLEAYHGIELVDSILAAGVTPCYICGCGETCVLSAARARHGADLVITPDIIPCLERQTEVIARAAEIGQRIKAGQV
jgi:multimeric flavodoxin WrbA